MESGLEGTVLAGPLYGLQSELALFVGDNPRFARALRRQYEAGIHNVQIKERVLFQLARLHEGGAGRLRHGRELLPSPGRRSSDISEGALCRPAGRRAGPRPARLRRVPGMVHWPNQGGRYVPEQKTRRDRTEGQRQYAARAGPAMGRLKEA